MCLLSEVVALAGLLADVYEAHASPAFQVEVTLREHASKNSEIQQVLWPAHHGRPRVEQEDRRTQGQDRRDGGSATAFETSDPEQRRGDRGPRIPCREKG